MKKHIGSTIAFILGFLLFSSSLANPQNPSGLISGPIIILGALAYRSAKKRKLEEVRNSLVRKILEIIALALITAAILFQNNLVALIESDPVSNLIIPLWTIVAYIVVTLKKRNPTNKEGESSEAA